MELHLQFKFLLHKKGLFLVARVIRSLTSNLLALVLMQSWYAQIFLLAVAQRWIKHKELEEEEQILGRL
jgi:hypothetical protein